MAPAATPACPPFRFNQHNGSELYDSFELQQVVKQLNLAVVKASAEASSPITSALLNSPFYIKCLGRTCKLNVKASRRISFPQIRNGGGVQNRVHCESKSIFQRFWNIAKQGFLRAKRTNSGF